MIKAAGTSHGIPLLLIGLSGENVTRLLAGEPVLFDTVELGLPRMQVLIVGGRTEDDIAAELKQHGLARYLEARPAEHIAIDGGDRG